jgi:hypothetical protein
MEAKLAVEHALLLLRTWVIMHSLARLTSDRQARSSEMSARAAIQTYSCITIRFEAQLELT